MRIAMFGGSFNPVHNGHIQLAEVFVQKLRLDKLIVVPAYVSPFKRSDSSVSPLQRLEMCQLAFENMPCAEVSDIEIQCEGASYTYLTLEKLSEIYPNDKLYLITGADMFLTIHKWKNPEVIFRLAAICGVPRNDDDIAALEKQAEFLHTLGAETEILDICVMTVSSTQVRESMRNGQDISTLVPPKVESYIRRSKLYT